MGLFSKKKHHTAGQVDENRLPRHIAVIMDGNGRWAKRRGLPRTAGHKVGAEVFRKIATHCKELGVEYLTVYAFSTENWKRPADEVNTIMGLLKQYMLEAIDSMERDQIRLRFLGDMSALSPELQELARRTNEISSHIQGFQANVCLNYGGRDELLRAARHFAAALEIAEQPAHIRKVEEVLYIAVLAVADDDERVAPAQFHEGLPELGIEPPAVLRDVFQLVMNALVQHLPAEFVRSIRQRDGEYLVEGLSHEALDVRRGQAAGYFRVSAENDVPGFADARGAVPESSVEVEDNCFFHVGSPLIFIVLL